jgi:hypothetical protein
MQVVAAMRASVLWIGLVPALLTACGQAAPLDRTSAKSSKAPSAPTEEPTQPLACDGTSDCPADGGDITTNACINRAGQVVTTANNDGTGSCYPITNCNGDAADLTCTSIKTACVDAMTGQPTQGAGICAVAP